jgi:hypothetical protein
MAKGNKPTTTPAKPVITPPGKPENAPSTTGEKSGKGRGNNPPKKG